MLIVLCSSAPASPDGPLIAATWREGFESGLSSRWRVYDNWAKPAPELHLVASPCGFGKALQARYDDKSDVAWLDKGFVCFPDPPLSWNSLEFIEVGYLMDKPVANLRIFISENDGDFWDFVNRDPEIGKPARMRATRGEFRFGWGKPGKRIHEKDAPITAIFFSFHNVKPPNSGEEFTFTLDDILAGVEFAAPPYDITLPEDRLSRHVLCTRAPGPVRIDGDLVDWARSAPFVAANRRVWSVWQPGKLFLAVESRDARPTPTVQFVGGKPLVLNPANPPPGTKIAARDDPGHSTLEAQINQDALGISITEGARLVLPLAFADAKPNEAPSITLHLTRAITPAEAFAVALRTGAVSFVASEGRGISLEGPPSWQALLDGATFVLTDRDGAARPLVASEAKADPWAARRGAKPNRVLESTMHEATCVANVAGRPVTVRRLMPAGRVNVDTERDMAIAAQQQLTALKRRLADRADIPACWDTKEGLVAQPRVTDRKRVDPREWSLIDNPVTWEDLGGGFVGGAQCGIGDRDRETFFKHYDFGRAIKPHLGYFLREGWEGSLKGCKEDGLIVMSVWGFVPERAWNGGFGDVTISPEQHEKTLEIMGRQFLGYENGEQDGRYLGSYAPKHRPRSRHEARKLFDEWHQLIYRPLNHFMVALGSLNFSHYYAEEGNRILGLETAQALPSPILDWCFLRGASKQYGVLTWNCISVYNRWGYKSYTEDKGDHGPGKGTSVSLMKRLYYVTYMYGSATNAFESAYFTSEKDEGGFPKLSPVGQVNVEAVKWRRDHPNRGVPYTPVAIMLDREAGWVPPRHLYTGARHLVWGNMPYDKGDHATDALFRMIFPDYEDCSYFKDERGYLTETPYGDQFDTVLSNIQLEPLQRYRTVVLSGNARMEDDLVARLGKFVRAGGDVILDAQHAGALPIDLTGVNVGAMREFAQHSLMLSSGKTFDEAPYAYVTLEPTTARVLAVTERGKPLVTVNDVGGKVIVVAADCLVDGEWEDPEDECEAPLRHRILKGVAGLLGGYFHGLNLIRPNAPGIQYLVNVTEDPRELIVTLVNNGQEAWSGTLTPRRGEVAQGREWITGQRVSAGHELSAEVPPGDLRIFRLLLTVDPSG